MKRRSFVKASLLTGAASSLLPKISRASTKAKKSDREFYELRIYTLKNDTQQKLVEDYFENAAIPALNRLGSKNIGVFTDYQPSTQTRIFAIIPYNSLDDFLAAQSKLAEDSEYQTKAAPYLSAPMDAPAYDRIESSLLQAFPGMPKLAAPEKKERFFELRQYESPTEAAGKKKISMFNDGDEIAIFKKIGFNSVFYSEMLIGNRRPNLVYMVTFDSMASHDEKWKAFGADPAWVKLRSMPEYPDALVSHITSTFIVPTGYSQI
jgi:hypothetical protein